MVRAIAALENKVERGLLPVGDITDTVNSARPENRQFSPQRVGRILDSLGLEKGYIHGGYRAVVWDKEKISRLQDRYGVQQTSPTSPPKPENHEKKGELGEHGEHSYKGSSPENSHIFPEQTKQEIISVEEIKIVG